MDRDSRIHAGVVAVLRDILSRVLTERPLVSVMSVPEEVTKATIP